MSNINILIVFYFRFLINCNLFLVVGPLGGVPPPKPACFFPGLPPPDPRDLLALSLNQFLLQNWLIWKGSGSETMLNRLDLKNHV